jgi:hypothetical protein
MAYPAYSIVIEELTVDNATVLSTTAHLSVQDAKDKYKIAINAGRRAFIYEQPEPDKFHRNDSQPFAT